MIDFWGALGLENVRFPCEGSPKSRFMPIGFELHFGAILGSILVPFGGTWGSEKVPRHLLDRVGFGVDFWGTFRGLPKFGIPWPVRVTCHTRGPLVHHTLKDLSP